MALVPVKDALAQILKGAKPLASESIPLSNATGRVLAEPLKAQRPQPPFAASAMDGYAVKAKDVIDVPVELNVVGEAPAGHGYQGRARKRQAVRIFTGAPLPSGTDTIVIQENTEAGSRRGFVRVLQGAEQGKFVREAGLDFRKGR